MQLTSSGGGSGGGVIDLNSAYFGGKKSTPAPAPAAAIPVSTPIQTPVVYTHTAADIARERQMQAEADALRARIAAEQAAANVVRTSSVESAESTGDYGDLFSTGGGQQTAFVPQISSDASVYDTGATNMTETGQQTIAPVSDNKSKLALYAFVGIAVLLYFSRKRK